MQSLKSKFRGGATDTVGGCHQVRHRFQTWKHLIVTTSSGLSNHRQHSHHLSPSIPPRANHLWDRRSKEQRKLTRINSI